LAVGEELALVEVVNVLQVPLVHAGAYLLASWKPAATKD
jgi:hypothetical protein